MKRIVCLIFLSIMLLLGLSYVFGQVSNKASGNSDALEALGFQGKEDSKRNGLDICFSFDELGKVAKISIESNQIDEVNKLRSVMKRENVIAVIDNLVPERERGVKVNEPRASFGRAYTETIIYEKVRIDLTIVCNEESCGVSYAEIRWRTNQP